MNSKLVIKVKDVINFGNELEMDLSEFTEFSVGTNNLSESNLFLNSLWREFNSVLAPVGLEKCPWAYLPQKHIWKNKSITYFGSMRTKIGYVHVAISYRSKGCIDNILFYVLNPNGEACNKSIIKGIIKVAKNKINIKFRYDVEYELIGKYENNLYQEVLNCYTGRNFHITNEENVSKMHFYIEAQDFIDAQRIAQNKMMKIVNFLAVETNIYFTYGMPKITEVRGGDYSGINNIECVYQKDIADDSFINGNFIDFYPTYNNKVLLSNEGVNLIDKITEVNTNYEEELNIFLNACYHFREGMEREYNLESTPYKVLNDSIVKWSKINQPKRQGVLDISLTLYLSAIETVTLIDRVIEKCDKCGQLKFEIRKNVSDFINEYLANTHGELFKKIYDLRSGYLHKGELTNESNLIANRPLLDDRTGTGCIDTGFITINIKGVVAAVAVANIREWTSYSLRNFYKNVLI